jgi:hypothetical protein
MDIRRCLVHPPMEDRAGALRSAAWGIRFHGAIEFLLEQFQDRDEAPDEELVDVLLGVAKRTRSRSIAFGALNFLVETGVISEFQALDRLDAWKEQNQPRG